MAYQKIYVETVVKFLSTGGMRPQYIVWINGEKYKVDKVKQILRAPSKTGGLITDKYVCAFGEKVRNLFYEKDSQRWFVERRIE